MIDDIYLRYIQFRALHRIFYTNNTLFKMVIKESDICNMYNKKNDSNEHMLLKCEKTANLWSNVTDWIRHIGLVEYEICDKDRILGAIDALAGPMLLSSTQRGLFLMLRSLIKFLIYIL